MHYAQFVILIHHNEKAVLLSIGSNVLMMLPTKNTYKIFLTYALRPFYRKISIVFLHISQVL